MLRAEDSDLFVVATGLGPMQDHPCHWSTEFALDRLRTFILSLYRVNTQKPLCLPLFVYCVLTCVDTSLVRLSGFHLINLKLWKDTNTSKGVMLLE